jgi:peroxiredoxin family protein/rhodanese-related sulfurtransferase/TusA-related sulfurtransferase
MIRKVPVLIPLAWGANRQGRLCADNIAGLNKSFNPQLGTSILKVFDYTAGSTGLNERQLQKAEISFETVIVNRNNHAGYYPGAVPLTIKLHYGEDGTIYGAQAFGLDGVDKRIDVIATAIKGGLKAWELQEIEIAYAPPFNSAKDPVNILGYMVENKKLGFVMDVTWQDLENLDLNTQILDIRTSAERILGSIPGDIHIDLDELRTRLDELDKSKEYIVYCAIGHRGYIAARILTQHGFKVRNLSGGYKLYKYAHSSFEPREVALKKGVQYIEKSVDISKRIELDACGLQCPGPIMKTKEAMGTLENGQLLEVKASDPGFRKDIYHWAENTGNQVIETSFENNIVTAIIQKGTGRSKNVGLAVEKKGQTIVVFSGDLDKVMAAMIIANGALAMGKDVTLFFTFWGLNALRKPGINVKKPLLAKMFGLMMPEGLDKLNISKMNLGGMGTIMMKKIMHEKNVDSLDTHFSSFLANKGRIIACTMSMDVLGITQEELIDGIEYAGVASYLGEAEKASSNLFI